MPSYQVSWGQGSIVVDELDKNGAPAGRATIPVDNSFARSVLGLYRSWRDQDDRDRFRETVRSEEPLSPERAVDAALRQYFRDLDRAVLLALSDALYPLAPVSPGSGGVLLIPRCPYCPQTGLGPVRVPLNPSTYNLTMELSAVRDRFRGGIWAWLDHLKTERHWCHVAGRPKAEVARAFRRARAMLSLSV